LIEEKLMKHGAILFRGFGLTSAEHFDNFALAFGYENFPYHLRRKERRKERGGGRKERRGGERDFLKFV
jgi:hypothetical protein